MAQVRVGGGIFDCLFFSDGVCFPLPMMAAKLPQSPLFVF
jgi:hypothetical protein